MMVQPKLNLTPSMLFFSNRESQKDNCPSGVAKSPLFACAIALLQFFKEVGHRCRGGPACVGGFNEVGACHRPDDQVVEVRRDGLLADGLLEASGAFELAVKQ